MTPMDGLNYLIAMLTGNFWKPYRFLDEGTLLFSDWLTTIRGVSAALLVLLFVMEYIRKQRASLISGEFHIAGLLIWSSLLSVFLVSADAYWFGTHLLVEVGSSIARSINNVAMDAIDMEISNLLKGILASTQNPLSFFTALLEMTTPIGFLTVVSYWVTVGLLFAIPLLQSLYVAVFVLLGPILLPFSLWAPTRGVGKKWLLSLLGSAFISIFG
nr:type IV secretion system protein [Fibrobacterota bacterium]